ncbi:MAG: 16S rRNA (guanine(527)-N(7))-methyltransferase RsmG [bacterium]|nr:16S rRNA (guanine(527)-N(7))-methyltransferase RsmG [bacterium]
MQKILNLPNVDKSRFERQLQAYLALVSHWNSITNLVSATNVDNLLTELTNQSLAPLLKEPLAENLQVLDIGSGAGFPAIPIKLARPDLAITLLEPRRKRCLFLRRVISELALDRIDVVQGRLEDFAYRKECALSFDLVMTRGTGSAPEQLPYVSRLVKPGGQCWFYKGSSAKREAKQLLATGVYPVRLSRLTTKLTLLIVTF